MQTNIITERSGKKVLSKLWTNVFSSNRGFVKSLVVGKTCL